MGCCLTSCSSYYHFMCARQCHCVFLEDKKVYCPRHRDLIKGEVKGWMLRSIIYSEAFIVKLTAPLSVVRCSGLSLCLTFVFIFFQVVSGFEVTRRILVDLEGISLRRKWLAGLEPENVHMMIGMFITVAL